VSCFMNAAVKLPKAAMEQVVHGNAAPDQATMTVRRCFELVQRECGRQAIAFFDGAVRPYKAATNAARRDLRAAATAKAKALHAEGAHATAIQQAASAAAGVTPELRRACVCELSRLGVQVIEAPFEADGQMAFAFRNGSIDAVLTSDSDLLALGCRVIRLSVKGPISSLGRIGQLVLYDVSRLPSPQTAIDTDPVSSLASLVAASGVHVLVVYASLVGCDFTASRKLERIGHAAALAILSHLHSLCGISTRTTPEEVLHAIKTATYRTKSSVIRLLPADAADLLQSVWDAFLRQPVLVDSASGTVGALSGEAWENLPRPEMPQCELPSPQSMRKCSVRIADSPSPKLKATPCKEEAFQKKSSLARLALKANSAASPTLPATVCLWPKGRTHTDEGGDEARHVLSRLFATLFQD